MVVLDNENWDNNTVWYTFCLYYEGRRRLTTYYHLKQQQRNEKMEKYRYCKYKTKVRTLPLPFQKLFTGIMSIGEGSMEINYKYPYKYTKVYKNWYSPAEKDLKFYNKDRMQAYCLSVTMTSPPDNDMLNMLWRKIKINKRKRKREMKTNLTQLFRRTIFRDYPHIKPLTFTEKELLGRQAHAVKNLSK